jgi:hypothetical protein
MPWAPASTPYPIRKPGELTTFELQALLEDAEEKLAGDLEPYQRSWYVEWLRQLLAEKDERAVKAAQHARSAKAALAS